MLLVYRHTLIVLYICLCIACFTGNIVWALLIFGASTSSAAAPVVVPAVPVVVPVPPGGAADFVARLIAQKMSESMQQIVVVENVGGATGTIAATQVARSKPDGYTLLLSSSTTHATAPAFFNNLSY